MPSHPIHPFLLPVLSVASPPPLPLLLSTLASARAAPSPATLAHLSSLISSVFSVPDLLAVTFLLPPTTPKDPSPLGLDLESLTIFYEGVVKLVRQGGRC